MEQDTSTVGKCAHGMDFWSPCVLCGRFGTVPSTYPLPVGDHRHCRVCGSVLVYSANPAGPAPIYVCPDGHPQTEGP